MDFGHSEEQREFRALCRRFAAEVIRPVAAKHDAEESTPWEVIKAAREWGLHGIEHLQRLGTDPDGQFSVIYAEELHWGCAGIALAISGSALAAAGLAASGTPEQIAQWVPECFGVGDEIKLGAYAVTEPQAGSDVKSLRTTAKRDGDEWVLNGTKVFITNGGIADVHVVVATVDPELGHRGQASFVIAKGTPGPRAGQEGVEARHPRLAHRRGDPGGLPDPGREPARRDGEARAQARARPLRRVLAAAPPTRSPPSSSRGPIVGASALGIAQAAYEWTLAYLDNGAVADPVGECLDESSTAGRPPLERQWIQQRLADVATEIEAARLLVQRASWMGRNGIPMTGGQGSMSKLKGGDVAMWATRTCMDLVGPYAQTHGLPAREVVPRREDLPAVRGHGRDPAPGHLADAGGRVPRAIQAGRRGCSPGDRVRRQRWQRLACVGRRHGCRAGRAGNGAGRPDQEPTTSAA